MNIIKFNSLILVIYLYITSITLLFSPFISVFIVKNIFLISLILVTLFINKFNMTRKIIIFYVLLILLISINILAVSHKDYVITDGVTLIMFSFPPIYLLTQKSFSYSYFKVIWMKSAIIFTYLLPIYYLYRLAGYISYYEIGFLSHLNILIFVYVLLANHQKKNISLIIYLVVNVLVLTILGSRMVLIASLLTSICAFLLLSNKKSIKFYFKCLLIFGLGILITQNLISILNYINDTIAKYGLKSRNLSMFIAQLSGGNEGSTMFLSGRDNIYPLIFEYLIENGVFPSGLGVTRILTNGTYYHSHNFFTEIILIFGLIGSFIILGNFLFKISTLVKARYIQDNYIKLNFLVILLTSFLIRSLTGTYFITDVIFLFCLGVILSISNKVKYV